MFYSNWRVKKTLFWLSFGISLVVAATAFSLMARFAHLPTVGLICSAIVSCLGFLCLLVLPYHFLVSIFSGRYPLHFGEFFAGQHRKLIYFHSGADAITEWVTPPDRVVFYDLKIDLKSFEREGKICFQLCPFPECGQEFQLEVCLSYSLKKGIGSMPFVTHFKTDEGVQQFVSAFGQGAMKTAVKKVLFYKPGHGLRLKVQPFEQTIEKSIENFFNFIFAKDAEIDGQALIEVSRCGINISHKPCMK